MFIFIDYHEWSGEIEFSSHMERNLMCFKVLDGLVWHLNVMSPVRILAQALEKWLWIKTPILVFLWTRAFWLINWVLKGLLFMIFDCLKICCSKMIEILTKNQRKILVSFTNYKNIIDSKKMVKNKRLNSHLMINQKKS